MKIAKLVLWSPMTRVVIDDEGLTADQIYDAAVEAAQFNFLDKIHDEYRDHIEDVIDDLEMPYNIEFDK